MLAAFLLGFAFGFVGSMPIVGPVALLVFSRGLQDRLLAGRYLAAGAAIAESIYAYFAFWGISELLQSYPWIDPVMRGAGAVLLTALGLRFIFSRSVVPSQESRPLPAGRKRSLALGFTITALNPALVATWTAAVAIVSSLGIVTVNAAKALPFSAGAALGIVTWFWILLELMGRFRTRFRHTTLERTMRVMGVVLVLFGIGFGVRFLMYFSTNS